MRIREHIYLGFIFSVVLYFLFEHINVVEATIIFFSSWLFIDFDHLIHYYFRTGDLNPIRLIKWSENRARIAGEMTQEERDNLKRPVYIFHSLECLLIILLLYFVSPIFFLVFIGFVFHLFLDLIYLHYRKKDMMYKVSLIWTLIRNRDYEYF